MTGFSSLGQMGTALYARRKWMLLVASLVIVLVIGVCAMLPPRFTAVATVVFNTRGADVIVDKNDTWSFGSYINGEVDLMGSRRVMQRAAADPALRDSPLTLAQQQRYQNGNAPREVWLARHLGANTTVASGKNVRTVSLSTTFDDPKFAALAANTIAKAYLATALELRVGPARQNVQFYRQQRTDRARELVQAQQQLADFLQQTGMTGNENRSDADDLQLRTLAERLSAARVEQAGSMAESAVGGVDSAVAAGTITNSVITQLRQDIAKESANLRDLTVLGGPNFPSVVQSRARLDELNRQLGSELAMVTQGVQRRASSISRESATISQLEASQRRQMSASASDRARLEVLEGDVTRAKANSDAVAARLAELELASAVENPNAAILSPADVPRGASFPFWPLIVAAATAAGLLLGAIVALGVELVRPRVRSGENLEQLLGGAPVLCDLTA